VQSRGLEVGLPERDRASIEEAERGCLYFKRGFRWASENEQMVLTQTVVPGFGNEQTDPDFSVAFNTTLTPEGTINGGGVAIWMKKKQ